MTCAIREGDYTSTGGVVLRTSGTLCWEERRVARMGDPVWCEACQQVGFIAQGNPTFVDNFITVATHGQAVSCACPKGTHTLISSQDQLRADMEASITIPEDLAELSRDQALEMMRLRLLAQQQAD